MIWKRGEKPIKLNIGGNFKADTYKGFVPLLDKLAEAPFRQYIQQINLKPVQDISSNETEAKTSSPCDVQCFSNENVNRIMGLREEMAKRDLPMIDGIDMGPCDFYRGDSYTIGLERDIAPCIAFVDNKSCSIGSIHDPEIKPEHQKKTEEWHKTKPWTKECYNCSFLPVCTGGCRATAYSNGYSWNSVVCEKEYFTKMSSALAKELLGIEGEGVPEPSHTPETHTNTGAEQNYNNESAESFAV